MSPGESPFQRSPAAAAGTAELTRRNAPTGSTAAGRSERAGQGDAFAFPPSGVAMSHSLSPSPKYGKVTPKSLSKMLLSNI